VQLHFCPASLNFVLAFFAPFILLGWAGNSTQVREGNLVMKLCLKIVVSVIWNVDAQINLYYLLRAFSDSLINKSLDLWLSDP